MLVLFHYFLYPIIIKKNKLFYQQNLIDIYLWISLYRQIKIFKALNDIDKKNKFKNLKIRGKFFEKENIRCA